MWKCNFCSCENKENKITCKQCGNIRDEEYDFESEERLEVNGILSSAAMDEQDEEEF